jgi:hypothetical protein
MGCATYSVVQGIRKNAVIFVQVDFSWRSTPTRLQGAVSQEAIYFWLVCSHILTSDIR